MTRRTTQDETLHLTVIAVGLLTVGTAGVAAAQTTGGGSTSPTDQPAGTQAKAHRARRPGVAVLAVAAKTLGVKPRELVTGLCGGQTVAQIASQHGKSTQDVIAALVKAADARIDQLVKAGRLDAAKAAQRKSTLEARVTARVNSFKPSATRCQKLQGSGPSGTPSST
jgi:hypothetical protein